MKSSTNLIQQLISISSLSGQEGQIIQYIDQALIILGINTQKIGENLVAHIKGTNQSKAIVFNAHVDTVQPGDEKLWKYSPLLGKLVGDKVFGLGASDEKAGVAGLMILAENFSQNKPPCDVWFHFVVKEEVDGSGTKQTMNWFVEHFQGKYKQIAGVLVEPTNLAKVELAHKGNVFVKLAVEGDSGHGSEPDKIKTHAVLVMAEILHKLAKLGKDWKKHYLHPILGYPTLGIGTAIQAGSLDCPNKFADTCIASLDVRTIPEMHDKVVSLISDYLVEYPVKVSYLFDPAPYGLTQVDDAIVQSIKKILPEITISFSKGSTDQCFFTQHNIPAIIFGPGESEYIHTPNEYCYPSKITQFAEIMKKVINIWVTEFK